MVDPASRLFAQRIVPRLRAAAQRQASDGWAHDQNEDDLRRAIETEIDRTNVEHQALITPSARNVARTHTRETEARNRRDMDRQLAEAASAAAGKKTTAKAARARLGVSPLGREPWLREVLEKKTQESLSAIQWATSQTYERAWRQISADLTRGVRLEAIANKIAAEYTTEGPGGVALAISKRRAAFIAANELGNVTAAITKRRHEDLGVETYRWITAGDERVRGPGGKYPHARPSHRARNGKLFRYDTPPRETPSDGHPGEDYRCRCHSEPVFESIEELRPKKRRSSRPSPALPRAAGKTDGGRPVVAQHSLRFTLQPRGRPDDYVLVSVDLRKVLEAFEADNPARVVLPGGGGGGDLGRIPAAKAFITEAAKPKRQIGGKVQPTPIEVPFLSYLDQEVDVVDGRHRLAALAELGYRSAPVMLEKADDVENFRRRFGVTRR